MNRNPVSNPPVLCGRGILTWNKSERVSDRYGSVWLMENGNSLSAQVSPARSSVLPEDVGKRCRLFCTVLETRQSTHIGDLFHGVFPSTPKQGETIILGTGLLFTEEPLTMTAKPCG